MDRGYLQDKSITKGNVHELLGMMLDFQTLGQLQITMVDYLKLVLEDFLEVITGRRTIPAANSIF